MHGLNDATISESLLLFTSGPRNPNLPLALPALAAEGCLSPDTLLAPKTSGMFDPSPENLDGALRSGIFGRIRWDDFHRVKVIEKPGGRIALGRAEITRLMVELGRRGFKNIPRARFEEALLLVAKDDPFDSAQEFLSNLPAWDGINRVELFLPAYLDTPSTPYLLSVGRYWWTAMIARILLPGCKADMVPVLVGPQGVRKSDLIAALVPQPEMSGEICAADKSQDRTRRVHGKILLEWSNLRGIKGSSDADEVKAFITSPHDEIRDPANFGMLRLPRRSVTVGTTSRNDFLRDVTGHRRYLPFEVKGKIDISKVIGARDQFWAEALQIVRERLSRGDSPVDYEDAERLASKEHPAFMREARWVGNENLLQWLAKGSDRFTTDDALTHGLHLSPWQITKREKNDMADTLRQLDYEERRTSVGRKSLKRWRKP